MTLNEINFVRGSGRALPLRIALGRCPLHSYDVDEITIWLQTKVLYNIHEYLLFYKHVQCLNRYCIYR